MHVIRTIPTPWAPYSVMFSRDGTRLAIGGGSWYGNGGIMLVDLTSGVTQYHPCDRLTGEVARREGVPAVSGVCFSPNDRHLAASTWSSGDGFLTGGQDGELDIWSWEGRWKQHRLRKATNYEAARDPELDSTWATYTPSSVVGICHLSDGSHWVSVSAGGEQASPAYLLDRP